MAGRDSLVHAPQPRQLYGMLGMKSGGAGEMKISLGPLHSFERHEPGPREIVLKPVASSARRPILPMPGKRVFEARLFPPPHAGRDGRGEGVIGAILGKLVPPSVQFVGKRFTRLPGDALHEHGLSDHPVEDGKELVQGLVPMGAFGPMVGQRLGHRLQDRQGIGAPPRGKGRLRQANQLFKRCFIDARGAFTPRPPIVPRPRRG